MPIAPTSSWREIAVIDQLMARLRVNRLRVHTGGVRDGLLLTKIESNETVALPTNRLETAERFASSCRVDLAHGRHVGELCGMIF